MDTSSRRPVVALITNMPTPYRVPVFNLLADREDFRLVVVFCAKAEPDREWNVPTIEFEHKFLRENFRSRANRFVHNNMDVVPLLMRLRPDVVITTGFGPTFLYAASVSRLLGIPHVAFTDGTLTTEQSLSRVHRAVRRLVFRHSAMFIAGSLSSVELYSSYRVPRERIFRSGLCIDNAKFAPDGRNRRQFDLMFCGRFVEGKQPLFALSVGDRVAGLLRRQVSMLMVGSGPLEDRIRGWLENHQDVRVTFTGFLRQEKLPAAYHSAKVFLFPTISDAWGVVVNEASAAGVAVVCSPRAGVTGDLIVDGESGFVSDLDESAWAERVSALLTDDALRERIASAALERVQRLTFEDAADGIRRAIHAVLGNRRATRFTGY